MTLHPSDPRHDGPIWTRLTAMALTSKVQYQALPDTANAPPKPKGSPRGIGKRRVVVLYADGTELIYSSMREAFFAIGIAYRSGVCELHRHGFVFRNGIRLWPMQQKTISA